MDNYKNKYLKYKKKYLELKNQSGGNLETELEYYFNDDDDDLKNFSLIRKIDRLIKRSTEIDENFFNPSIRKYYYYYIILKFINNLHENYNIEEVKKFINNNKYDKYMLELKDLILNAIREIEEDSKKITREIAYTNQLIEQSKTDYEKFKEWLDVKDDLINVLKVNIDYLTKYKPINKLLKQI